MPDDPRVDGVLKLDPDFVLLLEVRAPSARETLDVGVEALDHSVAALAGDGGLATRGVGHLFRGVLNHSPRGVLGVALHDQLVHAQTAEVELQACHRMLVPWPFADAPT